MPSFACTLFEKHYHYGVAAFVNSLYNNNYRGAVYAGYKGDLPAWCAGAKVNPAIPWAGASTLQVAADLQMHFLPVHTKLHFVYYKPYFMMELFKIMEEADGIAYFDPDIVIKCSWDTFEVWMSHGVALVDENRNWPATHPIKGEWKKVIHRINRKVTREIDGYINSGFCGVAKQNRAFLTVWAEVIEAATAYYNLDESRWGQLRKDRTYLFYNTDQDALNAAVMCCQLPISEMGPDAMDFIPGGYVMSHSLGRPKPWHTRFIRSALTGIGPSLADKGYWANSRGPLQLYSKWYLKTKAVKIAIASFISRFYKRS